MAEAEGPRMPSSGDRPVAAAEDAGENAAMDVGETAAVDVAETAAADAGLTEEVVAAWNLAPGCPWELNSLRVPAGTRSWRPSQNSGASRRSQTDGRRRRRVLLSRPTAADSRIHGAMDYDLESVDIENQEDVRVRV